MAQDFASTCRKHSLILMNGNVLAIDPASGGSSNPGWAAFSKGVLVKSGTISLNSRASIQVRLQALYESLSVSKPDVLVVEMIRGKTSHPHLHWSVGVIVAAVCPPVVLECPIPTWKKFAGKGHEKSDETDAIAIGGATIALARSAL